MENNENKKKHYFASKPRSKSSKESESKEFSKRKSSDRSFSKGKSFKSSDGEKKSYPRKSFKANKDESSQHEFKKEFRKPYQKDNFAKKDFSKKTFEKKEENSSEEQPKIRYFIYKCLYNIYFKKAFSNIEIDHTIRENNIPEIDAKLLTNIVYGTLHHEKILTWEMRQLCEKEPHDEAKIIILMSLYQRNYLDRIPEFAIINEAVAIAKKEVGEFGGKFVNAVLREAQRQNLHFSREACKDEYEYLSIQYNMPIWVIKMWERHYNKERMLALLEDSIKEPPLTVRVNIHKANKEKIMENPNFTNGLLAKNSLFYNGETPIAQTEEMKQGLISVQDESSQYVAEVLDPQENSKILDMCAAPGSKTQYIAELMNNTGKVLALDIHEHRVGIMKTMIQSLNLTNVTCICYDSTKLHEKEKLIGSFDKVLLDAPCLGLGVIRRKPDIIHDITEENLDALVLLQSKLLEEAYKMVKVGGEIVYSTCSVDKKENNNQITLFIGNHSNVKRVFEKQIFPDEYNSDGFYICKMIKEEEKYE